MGFPFLSRSEIIRWVDAAALKNSKKTKGKSYSTFRYFLFWPYVLTKYMFLRGASESPRRRTQTTIVSWVTQNFMNPLQYEMVQRYYEMKMSNRRAFKSVRYSAHSRLMSRDATLCISYICSCIFCVSIEYARVHIC